MEEALIQRDDPVPPPHAAHSTSAHILTYTDVCLYAPDGKGKDIPGSTVIDKQAVLSSDLVHALLNREPLCHHLSTEIIAPTSQTCREDEVGQVPSSVPSTGQALGSHLFPAFLWGSVRSSMIDERIERSVLESGSYPTGGINRASLVRALRHWYTMLT